MLTKRSRIEGVLRWGSLKDINRRKYKGSDSTGLNWMGQASLLVSPALGIDVKEHFRVKFGRNSISRLDAELVWCFSSVRVMNQSKIFRANSFDRNKRIKLFLLLLPLLL